VYQLEKTSAYLRMPYTAPREYKQEKLIWAKKWLLETLSEKPDLAQRWKTKNIVQDKLLKQLLKITPFSFPPARLKQPAQLISRIRH
jgi:hypothetical protein